MADPEFFLGGCANSQNPIILQIFSRQLHENERIWTRGGGASLAPLLRSANDVRSTFKSSVSLWIPATSYPWPFFHSIRFLGGRQKLVKYLVGAPLCLGLFKFNCTQKWTTRLWAALVWFSFGQAGHDLRVLRWLSPPHLQLSAHKGLVSGFTPTVQWENTELTFYPKILDLICREIFL